MAIAVLTGVTFQALTPVLAAFAIAVVGVRWFIGWLCASGRVAHENERTMHTGRVPQGGGAPVLVSVLAVMTPFLGSDWRMAVLLALAAGLALLSWANDRRDIAFPVRLAAHALAAGLALMLVPPQVWVFGGLLPFWLDRAIALLALVWFINLTNFMDGIDGNAGVQTISIATGYVFVITTQIEYLDHQVLAGPAWANFDALALAMIGAAAGFLVWNWHKARVFLGDVGSIPIGFLLGAMLLHLATTYSLAAAIILPMYYVTDATRTLLARFWRGEKVWQAHRSHGYQRAARAARSHSAIVVRIAVCNMMLIVAAMVAIAMPIAGLCIGVAIVGGLLWVLEGIAGPAAAPSSSAAHVAVDGAGSKHSPPA